MWSKVDDLNVFYKLSKLIFTKAGYKVERRKRIAREVIDILTNEFGIMLSDTVDCFWVLHKINSTSPQTKSGIEYFTQIVNNMFASCGIESKSYPAIFEQFNEFIEKIYHRINNWPDLSDELEAFEKMFQEKIGVVITSCHGVKGEEYNTVIAFGLLRGYVPHWDTQSSYS